MKKKLIGFWENNGLLKLIFLILAFAVFVLAVLVVQKNNEEKDKIVPDLVIPIVSEEDKEFAFNIEALALSRSDEYILEITNYKKDEINPNDVLYQITIMNKTKAEIEVHELENPTNLMQEQDSTVIEGIRLLTGEKGEVYYSIKMSKTAVLDQKEVIQVKVESIGS